MSDTYESGLDRCETLGCGKRAEPGSAWCHACLHSMPPPEPSKPSPLDQAALFRRTAAMLRNLRTADVETRRLAAEDADYFEQRAEALESVEIA